MLDFKALWEGALTYDAFVAQAMKHQSLWEGGRRLARIPDWAAAGTGARLRLLVIAEDWCSDAANTVPVLAKLADVRAGVELRIIRRDEHPEVMDRYLTNGTRSIPIVIALDEAFRPRGHWGPRPAALQRWVLENRPILSKEDFQREKRLWYIKDRGETTLREVFAAAALEEPAARHRELETLPAGEVERGDVAAEEADHQPAAGGELPAVER